MKKVLITGGSGFLGRRLGKKLKGMGYSVVLAARNNKQNFLAGEFSGCATIAMDVSNIESVRDIFLQVKPQIVIHAAATKFVDISEVQPMETIDVNVLGSQNVARVAVEQGVELVVGISTDKAAPPVRNTYGLSKAIMERMFCSMNGRGDTRFLCVRYGNVAWSTASVLTVWKKHLATTGVIETTGPDMLRFIFTVDEAVNLVVTAITNAEKLYGRVLSRYMRAAQIEDILKLWCAQEGARYVNIGARLGERIDEVLIGEPELEYTDIHNYDGIEHYSISFTTKASNPPKTVLSAGTTDRLSDDEILSLINNPPKDES